MTRLGVELKPVCRPVVGIAMCITPMGSYTHGRYGWFNRRSGRKTRVWGR